MNDAPIDPALLAGQPKIRQRFVLVPHDTQKKLFPKVIKHIRKQIFAVNPQRILVHNHKTHATTELSLTSRMNDDQGRGWMDGAVCRQTSIHTMTGEQMTC